MRYNKQRFIGIYGFNNEKGDCLAVPFSPSKMKAIIVNRNYNSHYAKMLVHIYFLIKELPHKIRLAGSRPMAAELIRMEDC